MRACDVLLYGLIDPQIARGRRLAVLARQAADGGATLLQYRNKTAGTRAMLDEAADILAALAGTGVPLLINDRVDVALAVGAQGVHVGREDMPPEKARALLGDAAIIGVTVKNADDLARLRAAPFDYACIGGVFATVHKDNPDPPVGLDGFAALRAEAAKLWPQRPVGAIAGITLENAASVMRAGADGIAVIGAMFAGADVTAQTRALRGVIAPQVAMTGAGA